MNKTVNINLAGIFFHIDEEAYGKLQRYLAAIKRSFAGMQGEDEIIADIEARIAELFSDKIKDERQVIGTKELDEVIAVMGQPEDYRVDDDIFEDGDTSKSSSKSKQAPRIAQRRFFRDTDNAYLGGVSSGMAHYMGIDANWVRVGWILLIALTWFTLGGTALIYLALWVFVPEAQTTADKLAMRGKAVNIDNITEKVKEGFENVADTVKNVDYDKYGNKVKSGAQGLFGSIGKVIMFFLKILAKIIGALLIIIGASVVISLLIGLVTGGVVDVFTPGLSEMPWVHNNTGLPIWLALLLVLFTVGIPFFFLFYLGLKILSSNLKSMPLSAKLGLLGLWLISSIVLGVFATREAIKYSDTDTGKVVERTELAITANDTLRIEMRDSDLYEIPFGRTSNYMKTIKSAIENVTIERDIRLIVRSTKDSTAYIELEKRADHFTYETARDLAGTIDYSFELENGTLFLDSYFTSPSEKTFGHWNDREVHVIVYLPEGATLIADKNTYSYHRNDSRYRDILDNGNEEKYLTVGDGVLSCDTCPVENEDNDWNYSDDGWQEGGDEDDENGTSWNGDINGPNWSSTDPGVRLNVQQQKVDLLLSANVTEEELKRVQKQLKEKDIDFDFSGSTFRSDDKVDSLVLSINTNDGYNGILTSSRQKLIMRGVRFTRNYNETGDSAFILQ